MRPRIAVVGAGRVGTAIAGRLAERDYADVLLLDDDAGRAAAAASDLAEAVAVRGRGGAVAGSGTWEEATGASVLVLAVDDPGAARSAAGRVAERCPDAVVVVVTRPVDPVCRLVLRVSEFPRARVVGVGGVVDSARFRTLLARELGVSPHDVTGLVVGAHDDTMVPLVSTATVGGMAISGRIAPERLAAAIEATRAGKPDELAAAAGAAGMVDAIVLDSKRVMACSVLCQGELGLTDAVVGVPVRLGCDGVEEILEVDLAPNERAALEASAAAVAEAAARL